MNRRDNRLFGLISLLIALSMLWTACGPAATQPAAQTEAPAAGQVKPAVSTGTPVVRILTFGQGFAWPELFGADGVTESARLKEFEQKEGMDVEMDWGDETTVRQKAAADLASGAGRYCILMTGSSDGIQTYGSGGMLEPLDNYFDWFPQPYFDTKDVYQSFIDTNKMNGVLYGLPYYSFGPGMIYRTDIFQKYGVTPPKTIDELYNVLETIKQGLAKDGITDVYPLTMRGAPGEEPTLDLTGFVYAYGGKASWFEGNALTPEQIKATKAQPTFNTGAFKDGFTAFVDLLQKYGPPGAATHTWVDMMNLYAQGKAVILMPSAINGYAALVSTDNETVKNNSDFAVSPVGPSGKMIQSFWTMTLSLNVDCPNKDKAWTLLTFLTGKESQTAFAERTGWPTVTMRSAMHSQALVDRWGEPEVQLNEDMILQSDPYYFPFLPENVEFMDRIGTAASEAISGKKTIDQALNDLQSWATDRMLRAGYYR
jgi:sorbitol/mannitol transport system substrate-binding protein